MLSFAGYKQGPNHKQRMSFIFLHVVTEGRKEEEQEERKGRNEQRGRGKFRKEEFDVGQSTKKQTSNTLTF